MTGCCASVTITRRPGRGQVREIIIAMADGSAGHYAVTEDYVALGSDVRHYVPGSCVITEPAPPR